MGRGPKQRIGQTFTSAFAMISLEEIGGACLTLTFFGGFSCFTGRGFFDRFLSIFFALAGLGIFERVVKF